MSNLMSMLYTGLSGILTSQTQISVAGQNLANIGNADYTRQRVNVTSMTTMKERNGAFGYGVKVTEVIRTYDYQVAASLRTENNSLNFWNQMEGNVSEIMTYFNELSTGSTLGESLKSYFDAWHGLANTAPDNSDESLIKRKQVLATASTLCQQIQSDRVMFDTLKDKIDERTKGYVRDLNQMSESIALLNKKITATEVNGQHANDLRDHRDALVNKMSEIANVSVIHQVSGSYTVMLGGMSLVEGSNNYDLSAKETKSGEFEVHWSSGDRYSDVDITDKITGGKMGGDFKTRNELIPDYITKLDELARTLISETNKLHVSGQGLRRVNSMESSNPALNPLFPLKSRQNELPYDVNTGSFQIVVYDGDGKTPKATYNITIDPTKDTLAGIAAKISLADGENSGLEAYVTKDNKLKITTATGETFAFGGDTSGFLMAAGFNSFFTGVDASTMSVDERMINNPKYITTSSAGAPGDNTVALKFEDLKQTNLDIIDNITIDEFYGYFSGGIASDRKQISVFATARKATVEMYTLKMTSISGVVMAEEQANLIQFQRVFEANSRYLNAVDEMLNIIVNSLGLVGR